MASMVPNLMACAIAHFLFCVNDINLLLHIFSSTSMRSQEKIFIVVCTWILMQLESGPWELHSGLLHLGQWRKLWPVFSYWLFQWVMVWLGLLSVVLLQKVLLLGATYFLASEFWHMLSFALLHFHTPRPHPRPFCMCTLRPTSTPVHANVHPLASAHSEVAQNATVGSQEISKSCITVNNLLSRSNILK